MTSRISRHGLRGTIRFLIRAFSRHIEAQENLAYVTEQQTEILRMLVRAVGSVAKQIDCATQDSAGQAKCTQAMLTGLREEIAVLRRRELVMPSINVGSNWLSETVTVDRDTARAISETYHISQQQRGG